MQTRSFRGSGEPAWVNASLNACERLGPDPRRALGPAAIRAASTGRTHDRTRPMLHQRKKALVNQAPSQPSQNPALQRAPNALQNGTSLLAVRPGCPVTSRGALWITAKNLCRSLTAPNGGIRSASSIGTIVRSSAVVVGQRSERGVP